VIFEKACIRGVFQRLQAFLRGWIALKINRKSTEDTKQDRTQAGTTAAECKIYVCIVRRSSANSTMIQTWWFSIFFGLQLHLFCVAFCLKDWCLIIVPACVVGTGSVPAFSRRWVWLSAVLRDGGRIGENKEGANREEIGKNLMKKPFSRKTDG